MRPTSVTVAYNGTASAPIPLDWRQEAGFNVSIYVSCTTNTVAKVEYTLDNVLAGATPTWLTAPSSTGLDSVSSAGAEVGSLAFPCAAVRLTIISGTSGAATMTVISGG